MKKIAFLTGFLTIGISYAFLYFGNIFPLFHTTLLNTILGISFEISLVLSSILLIILFRKEKKIYFILTISALVIFLIHWLLILTVGFVKPYSYAMDVVISMIYIIILANNWKFFFNKEKKEA